MSYDYEYVGTELINEQVAALTTAYAVSNNDKLGQYGIPIETCETIENLIANNIEGKSVVKLCSGDSLYIATDEIDSINYANPPVIRMSFSANGTIYEVASITDFTLIETAKAVTSSTTNLKQIRIVRE